MLPPPGQVPRRTVLKLVGLLSERGLACGAEWDDLVQCGFGVTGA
jgi:hypothetical protein